MIVRARMVVLLALWLASLAPSAHGAQTWSAIVDQWAARAGLEQSVSPGTDLPEILFAGVADSAAGRALLNASDSTGRAMSDSLLSFLSLPEPAAHRRLPGLYVIRDFGLPVDQRPPSWAQVRDLGVRVLRRVALDPSRARDLRTLRELDHLRPIGRDPRPGEVGALVEEFRRWWIDRGDDPSLTHDPTRIADPSDWIARVENDPPDSPWQGLRLLADLDQKGLKTRLFLERLNADDHAMLAAECVHVQQVDGLALEESGIEVQRWDPELGQNVGHRIERLRELARDVLDRVTDHLASGADEPALRNDWAHWWKTARFQARYWRDPHDSPTLEPYFRGIDLPVSDGGVEIAPWVRQLFVAVGYRDFLVEQFGPEQRNLVAELMELLQMDREQAIQANFTMAYQRRPILARRSYEGEWVAIVWPAVQDFVRDLLARLSGTDVPVFAQTNADTENQFWADWWSSERYDSGWYRDPLRGPDRNEAFEMYRERVD